MNKGCLSTIVGVILIALLISFPLFTIGVSIIAWGIHEYKINKQLKVKSKAIVGVLSVGLMLSLTGCVMAFNGEPANDTANSKPVSQTALKKIDNNKIEKISPDLKATPIPADQEAPKQVVASTTEAPKEEKNDKPVETQGTTEQIPVTLVKTIDGDTIQVLYDGKEQNVRYLLIDTPETSHPRLGKQPFGEEAKERNRALVNSGDLTIEFDVGERIDKYGRLLAYVYVNGESVQQKLLNEGLARVAYVYPPNTRHLETYEQSQKASKEKGLGIWSIENYAQEDGFKEQETDKAIAVTPPNTNTSTQGPPVTSKVQDPAPQQPGSCEGQIKGSNNGIYHTPGSTYYNKTKNVAQWFCSAEEAEQAGYRAPKR